jgi:DNA polymerase-3 subunit alpha
MGEGKDAEMRADELIQRYGAEEDVRDLIDMARQLEDLTRNAGKHAGGVVIAPTPLHTFCPLFAEHDHDGLGRNPVTQFDKDDVEAIGLVKFDFLGLRTLTIIDWAVKAINRRHVRAGIPPLDISALPLDDAAVYRDIFANGNTGAVFQFESAGMRRALKDAKPDRFEDLIALNALYRPGPMEMIPSFVARKHGQEEFQYPDPRTRSMLEETYGIMVYQEQVMQMAQIVGGYSLGGADLLRRAMGKKVPAEMAKHREIFRKGAAEGGVGERKADEIFDLMEKFAGYGFNKSHAAAYSLVAYQTAWLKKHYPAEFMAATLSSDMDKTEKVVDFLAEARGLGLTVLPPQVNDSDYMFVAVAADTVRYGLGAIKGVGRGLCEAIVAERQRGGDYRDLLDFCRRVDSTKLNRRALEAMVNAGALDALGRNRATLMLQLPEVVKATDQMAKEAAAGQVSLFGLPSADAGPSLQLDLPECAEWTLRQVLDGERDTLGHYLSGHPFDPCREEVRQLVGSDLGELDRLWGAAPQGEKRGWRPEVQVVVAGLVVGIRRKGDSQVFVQLEDGRGRLECSVFAEAVQEMSSLLVRDRVLVVQGGLREDEFNGGWSLRLKQAWDFEQLCANHAQRLSLRVDLRDAHIWPRIDEVLARHRPGPTPLRLHLQVDRNGQGATGVLDLNGPNAVRVAPPLLDALRAQPGVRAVKLAIGRPWAN